MSSGNPPGNGEMADVEMEFLLAEFDALRELKQQDARSADRRVEMLLLLGAGIAGGLALLSQARVQPRTFLVLAWLAALGLLAIGYLMLSEVIDRNIDVVDEIRAMNRIREHFAEQLPALAPPLLLMPTTPQFPRYGYQTNWRTAIAINSLACAAIVAFSYLLVKQGAVPDVLAVLLAIAAFVLAFSVQSSLASNRYVRAEHKAHERGTAARYDAEALLSREKQAGTRTQR